MQNISFQENNFTGATAKLRLFLKMLRITAFFEHAEGKLLWLSKIKQSVLLINARDASAEMHFAKKSLRHPVAICRGSAMELGAAASGRSEP